jgi:RNA polymerase sigma-70 factor (ECF subfamily)
MEGLTSGVSRLHTCDVPEQTSTLDAAREGDPEAFALLIEPFRRELRAHCYRLSGSLHDADDLVQESLLRAWRGLKSFESRSSLRTWLYKVATSACLDALEKQPRRGLPMDLGPAVSAEAALAPPRLEPIWVEPWPDAIGDENVLSSPEARYSLRESVSLAFLVALQLLPPKQRAVLLLREVLGWKAIECAELLGLSVAAVNSALQRARETIDLRAPALRDASPVVNDERTAALLARYVAAWDTSDVDALVSLLREDATLAMPPLPQWLQGAREIGASLAAMVLVPGSSGAFRLVPTRANGLPAFAAYRREDARGDCQALSIQVVEVVDERIASIVAFLDTALFAPFGLPTTLSGH